MKAITLYQPWAALISIAAKKIETRSWPTKYRGPLAIHASKKQPKWCREIERESPFKGALYPNGNYLYPWASCGCVVAVCVLDECYRIERSFDLPDRDYDPTRILARDEIAFGDYTLGRFMWMLKDIRKLDHPIPAKGKQGLWEWAPPDSLILLQ
jgi:hypothetical protein